MKVGLVGTIILICFGLNCNSQSTPICWSFQIISISIIPENPLPTDEVKIGFHTTFESATYEGYSFNIVGNNIEVDVCMGIGAAATTETFIDTVNIGPLIEGMYNLNFMGHGDYGVPICDNYSSAADSAWIDTTINVSITNGINSKHEFKNFTLFPNPATNQIYLESNFLSEHFEISILDLTGRIIFATNTIESDAFQNFIEINTSEFPEGIYIVEIICNENKWSERFVKVPN